MELIHDATAAAKLARAIAGDVCLYNRVKLEGRQGLEAREAVATELEEARRLYESRVRPEHWPLFTEAFDDALTSPPASRGSLPAMGILALVALVALGIYLVMGR